jgi:hypothetical protein
MPERVGPEDFSIRLKFGGGIHSRASEDQINDLECSSGQNFDLDLQNSSYRNRKPFDLIATVPNAAEIRGFANLLKADGTVSVLVQAAGNVYEWDGATGFTLVGTCVASAQLRGRLEHNFQLDDKVIITDLNLVDEIQEWDGTTFQQTSMLDSGGTAFSGDFRAKYCMISNERAMYANVFDNGTLTPHIIVGSKTGSFETISTNDRPSSSLGVGDAFFLIQPDYRPINGLAESFGKVVTSSFKGSAYQLSGTTAKDFEFIELFPRSGATGDESVVYVGNDIIIGRQGRLEALSGVQQFGDVENDDLTVGVSDLVDGFNNWTIAYNSRKQRIYCHPTGGSQIWVLHKPLMGTVLSPWSKWVTAHESGLNPTAMMNMLDPSDSLEYVFFGDASGNFYRLEGSGSGDGGTSDIKSERLSKLFTLDQDAQSYSYDGYLEYRGSLQAATVTLRFEFSGHQVFNEVITLNIPAITGFTTYGGGFYYSNGEFYGTTFNGRLTRQKFSAPGQSSSVQVRATIDGSTDFEIKEIGFNFSATS